MCHWDKRFIHKWKIKRHVCVYTEREHTVPKLINNPQIEIRGVLNMQWCFCFICHPPLSTVCNSASKPATPSKNTTHVQLFMSSLKLVLIFDLKLHFNCSSPASCKCEIRRESWTMNLFTFLCTLSLVFFILLFTLNLIWLIWFCPSNILWESNEGMTQEVTKITEQLRRWE